MKWLKKVGALILKGTEFVTGFAPIAAMTFPGASGVINTVSTDLAEIADIILKVETMGQALNQPGADKLKAATPLVAQIILQSAVLANHQIADPALFQAGAQKIADGMADVLNSLKSDSIVAVSKAG